MYIVLLKFCHKNLFKESLNVLRNMSPVFSAGGRRRFGCWVRQRPLGWWWRGRGWGSDQAREGQEATQPTEKKTEADFHPKEAEQDIPMWSMPCHVCPRHSAEVPCKGSCGPDGGELLSFRLFCHIIKMAKKRRKEKEKEGRKKDRKK